MLIAIKVLKINEKEQLIIFFCEKRCYRLSLSEVLSFLLSDYSNQVNIFKKKK